MEQSNAPEPHRFGHGTMQSSWSVSIYAKPTSSAIAKIRKHPTSPSSVSFTVTINGNAGSIYITLTKEQTALLSTGRNYYDILVTKDSKTFKIIKGTAIVEESASL